MTQKQESKQMLKVLKGMIGLEIHCYLLTREKLFCNCKASREKGLRANTLICPICTGMPGAKPMLPNRTAVEKAVQIGLMLNCKINKELVWQRKHYDWPDMPKGYQNTLSGKYAVPVGEKGKFKGIGISSMHLEEDPASWDPETGEIDYNRSGLPLVEIITEPDFETSGEVMDWLTKLVHNLSYLKAVDANAGIKVDTNVNIKGKTEKVEIKNISSIEDIGKAIDYELERQGKEGNKNRETRRFDSNKGKTEVMRSKESGEDYRFISDPDLMDIVIDDKFIDVIKEKIPERPEEKLERFIKEHKIDKKNAEILVKNIDIAEFYEKVVEKIDAEYALPWITGNLFRLLNEHGAKLDQLDIRVEHFVSLLSLVKSGKITELQGKDILKKFYPKSFDPSGKVEEKITDEKKLKKVAEKVVKINGKAVNDYKSGDKKSFEFLMGQIMKETEKRADFKVARSVLEKVLK